MRKKLLVIILTLLIGFGWASTAFAGFGISPPYVKNNHIIPGSSYSQEINLLRSSAEEDLQANIEIDAPEIASWITIDKGNKFLLPKGQLRVPMNVIVNVPRGADVGGYQGHINIKVSPVNSGDAGVSVALGARVDVDLTITNETLSDFLIRIVTVPDIAQLEWPWNKWPLKWFFYRVKAVINIENTGNVKIAPSKVHLDVYDLTEKNLLESTSDARLSKIAPFSTKEITASFPTNLPVGQYWSRVKVYKGDEVINSYKLAFTVKPAGSMGNVLGNWPKILVGSLVVLIILIIFLFIRFKGWRIFIFIFWLLKKILLKIFGPFGRIIYNLYNRIKTKFWNWILSKAKEHDNDKK